MRASTSPDAIDDRGKGDTGRVDDLDGMVAQLQGAGIAVDVDVEDYPNGRFAQLADPDGNAIQLWQPAQ